jgi:hypothetical protein
MPTMIGTYPVPLESYTAWASSGALVQSTLLFVLTTELTVPPDPVADAPKSLLALYAICQMADDIYLEQPYVPLNAQPFQSQTIGSYSYNKGSGAYRETPAFLKAQIGHYTGLIWWDLAVREFGSVLLTQSAAITVFDRTRDLVLAETGRQVFLGPSDRNQTLYPFDVNAPGSDLHST